MSHCPQCKKLMRGVCRYCQPQEYIDVVQQAFMDFADDLKQRTWVGLTEDEILLISAECASSHQHMDIHFARAIEAKLRSKNS